jgi:hypothetical protein
MSDLMRVQEEFQKFLLSDSFELHPLIVQTDSVSVDTRLGIYKEAYSLRLIECLESNFSALYAYLGTEEFHRLAQAYSAQHPSSYRSIRWFGDLLPQFLKHYYPNNPHLAELADFEWKMSLSFDAADAPRVSVEDMMLTPSESWATMHCVVHPSMQRINYSWNVIPIWQALTHDQKLPELQQTTPPTSWILWRDPTYQIKFYSLSPEEAWAFDALIQEISFEQLCEGFCTWIKPEEVGLRAASYLKGWIQQGMLSELRLLTHLRQHSIF